MLPLVSIFNVLAIAAGLSALRRNGPAFLYLAQAVILLAFVNENVIVLHSKRWWGIRRDVFYNIYSLAEIILWYGIYALILDKKNRPLLLLCAAGTLAYSFAELFLTGSFNEFHSNSYSVFSASSLLLSLCYIFSLSRHDRPPARDPAFWLCGAAVCFHSIFLLNLVTMANRSYWTQAKSMAIFDFLQTLATCTHHILICIAFIIFSFKPATAARRTLS